MPLELEHVPFKNNIRENAWEEHSEKCMSPRPIQEVSQYHFFAGYDSRNAEIEKLRELVEEKDEEAESDKSKLKKAELLACTESEAAHNYSLTIYKLSEENRLLKKFVHEISVSSYDVLVGPIINSAKAILKKGDL